MGAIRRDFMNLPPFFFFPLFFKPTHSGRRAKERGERSAWSDGRPPAYTKNPSSSSTPLKRKNEQAGNNCLSAPPLLYLALNGRTSVARRRFHELPPSVQARVSSFPLYPHGFPTCPPCIFSFPTHPPTSASWRNGGGWNCIRVECT